MNAKMERKQKSHELIIASAAALLRGRGIRASSVMDVMKGAGLTVGGFYGHFESKEQLFTETLRRTARTMWTRLLVTAAGQTPLERALDVVRRYLSRQHRDEPESGCPLPAAVAEVAREGEPYRAALLGEVEELVQSFAELLGGGTEGRRQALGLIALMYGALSLSRAFPEARLGNELLEAAKGLAESALRRGQDVRAAR
jgi:TetR/AcrR family transcriptional regulator, transcriptional repressor for nem operon